jgi:hypothetical protein
VTECHRTYRMVHGARQRMLWVPPTAAPTHGTAASHGIAVAPTLQVASRLKQQGISATQAAANPNLIATTFTAAKVCAPNGARAPLRDVHGATRYANVGRPTMVVSSCVLYRYIVTRPARWPRVLI